MKNKLILILTILIIIPAFSTAHAGNFMVDAKWLSSHKNDANLVLIDMSDGTQYQRFHIPGAIHLPYQALNQTTKKRVSISVGSDTIIRFLGLLGIKRNSHVVIYDDMGGLNASRLFWELQRLKHEKVSLLNGGLVKWILDGHKVTNIPVEPKPVKYIVSAKPDNSVLATLEDINGKATILDVRSQEEYNGHPRQKRSGHIPGAYWWSWDSSVDFSNAFQHKPVDKLVSSLKQLGVTSKKQPLIVYCRSGHRASQSYFTLRNLGFTNVKLYDASMAEYQQSNKPLTMGMKP
jgi:thiosulfate/3-mercaptopyruvate sulfurtransferase